MFLQSSLDRKAIVIALSRELCKNIFQPNYLFPDDSEIQGVLSHLAENNTEKESFCREVTEDSLDLRIIRKKVIRLENVFAKFPRQKGHCIIPRRKVSADVFFSRLITVPRKKFARQGYRR
jgi:hypothetical protein